MSISLFNINNSGTSGTTAILSAINLNTRLTRIDFAKEHLPLSVPLYILPPGGNQLIGVLTYLNVHHAGAGSVSVLVTYINADDNAVVIPLSTITGTGTAEMQNAFFIAKGGTTITVNVQISGTGHFKYDVGAVANLVLTY